MKLSLPAIVVLCFLAASVASAAPPSEKQEFALAEIQQLTLDVTGLDHALVSFRASGHHYTVNPTLTPSVAAAAELIAQFRAARLLTVFSHPATVEEHNAEPNPSGDFDVTRVQFQY